MAERQNPDPRRRSGSGERTQGSRSGSGYSERTQPSQGGSGYSERTRPSQGGSGYGERTRPSQGGSGYSERTRPSQGGSGYGERTQPPRSGSGYRERPQPPREGDGRSPAISRSGSGDRRQPSPRRSDVIRCENCGEDYSITYRRCPFCDERPVRGGISGKRVANTRGGGYGRPASTLRVAGWVFSFAVILCAMVIVVRFMGAPIFGGKKPGPGTSSSTGQNDGSVSSGGDLSSPQPGGPDVSAPDPNGNSGDVSAPQGPQVEAVVLDTLDFTLEHGSSNTLTATLLPAGVTGEVTWSSSDPSVATVDANGLVTNVNAGSSKIRVTITAACGDLTAQCTVYCNPKPAVTPGTTVPAGSSRKGTITGADTGLNIRSGPGREYSVVASAQNGASVTVLGEENGWYQIKYSGTGTGYVSKEFVSLG